ncbi:glycosyltransferase family 2 protein [Lactobacillus amylovorus]|uniref:glycosyltransferase family 2 protein n=1 Tax=Lactobacillus amylovorus TaxID=1604 RepID=UPI003F9544F0
MKPRISIIVPVYNVENYLVKCIESILNQSFKNFELILVNDGSNDNSLNICKKYIEIDNRIKLISQINKGLSAARNTGLRYAKGNYICFIDSDDFVEKDYLLFLLNNIQKYNADIAMCEYYLTDDKGKKYSIEKFNEPQSISCISGKETFSYIYKENYVTNVVAWNKIYKKYLFDNIKYNEGHYFEDELIALPLFYKAKKVSFIRTPLYNYVQRQGSIMNTPLTLDKIQDKILINKKRINFFKVNKNKIMYRLAVQHYKDWIIEINKSNISNVDDLNFQSEYRKYFGIRSSNSFKLVFKDIIGYINLNLLSKMSELKNNI